MTRYRAIALGLAAVLACGGIGALAWAATPPVALDPPEAAVNPGAMDLPAEPVRPAVPTAARERAPIGNPLWAVPLRLLTATRERPLFSPLRRPPAPPVVAAPQLPPRPVAAKPAEPDHPLLTLMGTIVGDTEAMGVFIDQATSDVIRLHTGQDHGGWVLRTVHGREATFEKDSREATLALPAPGAAAGSPSPAPASTPGAAPANPVIPAVAAAPGGNIWMDGDGQLITPPRNAAQAAPGRPR